jgi:NitT/TauT family transport system substrate-binding protein
MGLLSQLVSKLPLTRRLALGVLAGAAVAAAPLPAAAQTKTDFKVCWSIYVGWMPWGYLQESGIMKKWADKYGIKVDIVQINDYVESINQYTAGAYDGCSMTNMDALSIPAGGGVDTTALIVGDFSNGNDGIVLKGKSKVADLKGQSVNLVELSVSHYLLARALEKNGLRERDIKIVNTSDADMIAAFKTPKVTAAVTWNPLLSEIDAMPNANLVFDSSDIPGEIIDLMVVNTAVLKANPNFGKALVGAWYEVLALMQSETPAGKAARESMAKASGTDLAGFDAQLKTTAMFWTPQQAVAFTADARMSTSMDFVRKFLFSKGILGQNIKSVDAIGISFPSAKGLGNQNNIKLRFDTTFMQMAIDGKL